MSRELEVALVSTSQDAHIRQALAEAQLFAEAWLGGSDRVRREIHVRKPTLVLAKDLASADIWDADVVVIDGHGWWQQQQTIRLGDGERSKHNRPWPDALPNPVPIGVRALVLGACSSSEMPVRDALGTQLSGPSAVLSSRVVAQDWHGYLLYPMVVARLALVEELRTADDYQWALELALLDARHLWTSHHAVPEDCKRHKLVAAPGWPCGDVDAKRALDRAISRRNLGETNPIEHDLNELGSWGTAIETPISRARTWS
jgi:hypothetical protein